MYDAKFPGQPPWLLEKRLQAAEKRAQKAEEFLVKTRPSVIRFAEAMAAELKANDDKSAWLKESYLSLKNRLDSNVKELHAALDCANGAIVRKQCIDVANFAMVIFDKILAEDQTKKVDEDALKINASIARALKRAKGK
jgi:LPS O-antigen subunit length determinant protein (WzzB/FepE family)